MDFLLHICLFHILEPLCYMVCEITMFRLCGSCNPDVHVSYYCIGDRSTLSIRVVRIKAKIVHEVDVICLN